MNTITVSALNRYVKITLESDKKLSNITVIGEISGISVNSISGHMYFVLKDMAASVRVACFKTNASRLTFAPKDGMKVAVTGRV
ncbi:MAG: exodeoxyribonuclease VII large subunit, partial [Oscillospiraceae bacterium]|nr:exodeoxyribonuclease VII large subunit [Oscillospiraceae bacterium]